MKVIYLLSGLGGDKRVFEFLDLTAFQVKHIDWITLGETESIEDYAKRLCTQITTHKPTLIGVSFGGMIATEIANHIECMKVILISSAETRHEIPFYYRLAGKLRLPKIIPVSYLKKINSATHWMFGTKTKAECNLLHEIIKSTDEKFLKWAIDKIVFWKNTRSIPNLIKIHGTADRILPLTIADYKIKGGEHFMIVNRANAISDTPKNST
jgi:pimeloyl-ACP methyl ester carboxylesterase